MDRIIAASSRVMLHRGGDSHRACLGIAASGPGEVAASRGVQKGSLLLATTPRQGERWQRIGARLLGTASESRQPGTMTMEWMACIGPEV